MKKTILLSGAFLFALHSWAQFVQTGTLQQARSSFSAVAWNEKVYFIGGQTQVSGGTVRLSYMDVYDESTGTVTAVQQDYPRFWPAVVAGDSGVYVIGGFGTGANTSRSAVVYKADGSWHAIDSIADAQFIPQAIKVGNYIIVGAGVQSSTQGSGRPHTNKIYIFNETTGVWTTRTLSRKRHNYSIATDGQSKVLFAGGFIGAFSDSLSKRVDIYDIQNDTWDSTSLSIGRGLSSAAYLNGKYYFAGGFYLDQNANWKSSDVVDIYDIGTGIWTDTILSEARGLMGVGVLHNEIVFFGGGADYNGVDAYNYSGTTDVYTDDQQKWTSYSDGRVQCYHAFATSEDFIYSAGGYNGSNYWNTIDTYSRVVGFKDLFDKSIDVNIYPNPSHGYINVVNIPKESDCQLMDQVGRLVIQKRLSIGDNLLDLSNVKPGLYYLNIDGNMKRIMVE